MHKYLQTHWLYEHSTWHNQYMAASKDIVLYDDFETEL